MPFQVKPALCIAGGALALSLLPTVATAQTLTNDMSCAQAQAQFERNGRVTTRTRSGAVLPIYGGLPVSQRNRLQCGRRSVVITKTVLTRDRRSCVIAVRCS